MTPQQQADELLAEHQAGIVSEAMQEPEIQIERRCDFIIRELDELCRLATNAETVDLVEGQKIAIGQIVTRAQLVASFLASRRPSKLQIVSNG